MIPFRVTQLLKLVANNFLRRRLTLSQDSTEGSMTKTVAGVTFRFVGAQLRPPEGASCQMGEWGKPTLWMSTL